MNNWKKKLLDKSSEWPRKVLIKKVKSFKDSRGYIQPLVDLPMKTTCLIYSKKGSVRANHYHKTDWHYCYLINGKMKYFYKKKNSNEKVKSIVIKKNQLFFTPPLIIHAMYFLEDTNFFVFSRNVRDQKSYEKDLIRTSLIDDNGKII